MTDSNIFFLDPGDQPAARVTRIYPHLELFSDGDPLCNTLFVLGRASSRGAVRTEPDRLLLIDPPADAIQRFRLDGDVAVLFTGAPVDAGLPRVRTQDGGVAHIRIGDHFLDIHSERGGNVIHFPALGILCGGEYGSDVVLPSIASGSDGSGELEALRLLASLLKRQHFQLFVPRFGSTGDDKVAVMKRLAADVSYLNSLRRVITDGIGRGDAVETIEMLAGSILPAGRSSQVCRAIHETNVEVVIAAARE